MKFKNYGDRKNPTILMIHGMGMTADRSFGHTKSKLEDQFHVILVHLDGHDGSGSTFTSIGRQAKKIATYLRQSHVENLYAIIGMSMGGFIMMDLICRCNINVQHLIFDSGYEAPVPCPRIIAPFIAWGFGRILSGHSNRLVQTCMEKMMGYCFKSDELCPTTSYKTICHSFISCHTYSLPENLAKHNNIPSFFLYGSKESSAIKGMKLVKKYLPNLKEICMGNVGHGEVMLNNPACYTAQIIKILC